MRKKRKIKIHLVKPDKKFTSVIVSKLINKIMKKGEKRTATKIVYQAAEIVEKWFKEKQKKEKKPAEKVVELKKTEAKETTEAEAVNQVAEINQEKELVKTSSSPFLTVLEGALANIRPGIEMKRRKQGSGSYRIPKVIDETRSTKIALRWLVNGINEMKSPQPTFKKLAEEIKNAYNKSGEAFKKKENLYKEAEAGKVFAAAR